MAMATQAKVLSGNKLERLVVRLQRHTGRSREACWRFVIQYGIKGRVDHRRWTEDEIQVLREELVGHSVEEVAQKLDRSRLTRQFRPPGLDSLRQTCASDADHLTAIAQGAGLKPCESHHVMTADHAAHLVLQFDAVAFMTRAGAMRVARKGLTIRPLDEEGLAVTTSLVTRLDDERPLVGEFVCCGIQQFRQ